MPKIPLDDLIQKKPDDQESGIPSKGKKPSAGKTDVELWKRLLNSLFSGLNDVNGEKAQPASDETPDKPSEETPTLD